METEIMKKPIRWKCLIKSDVASIITGNAEEAKEFVDARKNEILPVESRADAYNYSMARYHFYKLNFENVLKLLQQVNYFSVFYKIDSKKLLIQTFYEMNEMDSLDSAMNAFRVFIHRTAEVSELHKKNNRNFINLLYQLLPLRSGNAPKLDKLKTVVKNTEGLAEREWLLQKITELERNKPQPQKLKLIRTSISV